jgi:hypothetical protein
MASSEMWRWQRRLQLPRSGAEPLLYVLRAGLCRSRLRKRRRRRQRKYPSGINSARWAKSSPRKLSVFNLAQLLQQRLMRECHQTRRFTSSTDPPQGPSSLSLPTCRHRCHPRTVQYSFPTRETLLLQQHQPCERERNSGKKISTRAWVPAVITSSRTSKELRTSL